MLQFSSRRHGRALSTGTSGWPRPRACLAINPHLACHVATRWVDLTLRQSRGLQASNGLFKGKLQTPNPLAKSLRAAGASGPEPPMQESSRKKRKTKAPKKDSVAGAATKEVRNVPSGHETLEDEHLPLVVKRKRGRQKNTETAGAVTTEDQNAPSRHEVLQDEDLSTGLKQKRGGLAWKNKTKGKLKTGAEKNPSGYISLTGLHPSLMLSRRATRPADIHDIDENPDQEPVVVQQKRPKPRKKAVQSTDTLKNGDESPEQGPRSAVWFDLDDALTKPGAKADRSRVHIVNPDLVDDMIEYLKPTLKRHQGCDLISVWPGAGLWTKALHDAVRPRSHLLLEPDEATYRPFLQPLLDQKGVRLIAKTALDWQGLEEILCPENLPHQVEVDINDPNDPPCNDTLLVSMNLAMFPKKKFLTFQSITRMLLYQLIANIRDSSHYQKYGRVRTLIWIPDDEKHTILPRILDKRKKLAVEGELCTEYIAEVCGVEDRPLSRRVSANPDGSEYADRWPQMDLESTRMALQRMQKNGLKIPPGRETKWVRALLQDHANRLESPIRMWEIPYATGEIYVGEHEYLELTEQHKISPFIRGTKDWLEWRSASRHYNNRVFGAQFAKYWEEEYFQVMKAYHKALGEARDKPDSANERNLVTAQARRDQFEALFAKLAPYDQDDRLFLRDLILTLYRQPANLGPLLTWDRRPYELIPVTGEDFYPAEPCALLDIQPKAVHPLLRARGPGTDHAGAIFDLLVGAIMESSSRLLTKPMMSVWPGIVEEVIPLCKSLHDPDRGGVNFTGALGQKNRTLNQEQLLELLEQFMNWPYRPTYMELLGRLTHDDVADEESPMEGDAEAIASD